MLNSTALIDEYANVYLCVSAMQQNERGEWRRRKENFAGGLLLMIDDLGTGPGAKFPMSVIDALPPTCLTETSPDNFQATYFFSELETDINKFDALIRAFIERKFLGNDTGQAGVNRVFRPPIGINGKEKYLIDGLPWKPWRVRAERWDPDNRYSIEEIAKAFELSLTIARPMPKDPGTVAAATADRIEAFIGVRATLRSAGMIKREDADYSGWIQITCPWTGEHSGAADTGAAIREPAPENEWFGGFRCHHGHCEGRGWRDLTEWLSSQSELILAEINKNAPEELMQCFIK